MERGPVGVIVTAPSERAAVTPGDVVRQANGVGVQRCADVERAAAEAVARGLLLLLGVERDGRLLAVAAVGPGDASRLAVEGTGTIDAPRIAPPPDAATAREETTRAAAAPPVVARPTPRPRREASLPPRTAISTELRARAAAAAAALGSVDDVAQIAVPLALYERRLGEAEATIANLAFGVDEAEAAVRDVVEDALALHRTARDIRRAKLAAPGRAGSDRLGTGGTGVPYFSDSKVVDWVAAYPFLQTTIIAPPRETRFPVPGETSGRWSPDDALALLWERAHAAQTSLAAWAAPD